MPGEVVNARFSIDVIHLPKRLRKIILSLESGERTAVTVSSGENSTTYYEEIYYSEENVEIDPETYMNLPTIEIDLSFTLPVDPIQPAITSQLMVFHRALIKYDIARGLDHHHHFDIPYHTNVSPPEGQQATLTEQMVTLEISQNTGTFGDEIDIYLSASSEKTGYRNIRLELKREVSRTAKGHNFIENQRILLAEAKSFFEFPQRIRIPNSELITASGTNYSIEFYIAIVLDRRFQPDTNLKIP
ncbi:MAG: hypothetical protein IH840_03570, partial [Candidatus Heimdallarchaeota archaeon]|nr:hypothetical protein [Candidatus Heimdallarchaeota archaeon]